MAEIIYVDWQEPIAQLEDANCRNYKVVGLSHATNQSIYHNILSLSAVQSLGHKKNENQWGFKGLKPRFKKKKKD